MAPRNNTMATVSLISSISGWVLLVLNLCVNFLLLPMLTVITAGFGGLLYICTGCLGCLSPIAWLVAVITGHVGKGQIKQTGEGGDGQAAAGLIMGYIGLGLILLSICVIVILSIAGVSLPILALPFLEQGF
jgi:hypothetical protein